MKLVRLFSWLSLLFAFSFSAQAQFIRPFAGTFGSAYFVDSSWAPYATLEFPTSIAIDRQQNLFFVDAYGSCIRKIDTFGLVTSIAGITDSNGFVDDCDARISVFHYIGEIAVDRSGSLYIADEWNNRIRKLNFYRSYAYINTIAGNGSVGYSGDGGTAMDATLNTPGGVTVDSSGNVYIADTYNNAIRKVDLYGNITTIAGGTCEGYSGDGGPATAACLYYPGALCVDRAGNLFVSDQYNYCIRKIDTSGIISTIAGVGGTYGFSGDGGSATAALMTVAGDLTVDNSGNILFTDGRLVSGPFAMGFRGNDRVRKINTSGIITTIAGNGTLGNAGDFSEATAAQLRDPHGLATDDDGYVYISDADNYRIRLIDTCHGHNLDSITGPSSVCIGSTITVSDSASGGAWTTSDPATATIDSSMGIVRGLSGGVVTISYSKSTTCGTVFVEKSILVNPYAGIIEDYAIICPGLTSTFHTFLAGGSWSSSNTAIATMSASGVVAGVSSGSATISYALSTSCGTGITTFPITVSPSPEPGTIAGPTDLCRGTATVFTDTASSGIWSCSDSALVIIDSTGRVTCRSITGVDTIKYTVRNSCGTATAEHVVEIQFPITAGAITGASSVCAAAALTLSDTASGGSWSSSSTSVATVSSSGSVHGVAAGSVTISYAVTNSCGTDYATHAVTVNPLPVAGTIRGTTAFCQDSSVTLAISGGATGGTWSSSNAAVATVNSSGVVRGLAGGSATISYAVTNSCGTAFATAVVTISPLPAVSAISGASSVCPGITRTLTDATTGGAWSSASTAIASVSASGVVTAVSGGTTTISYTVTNSCGSTSATSLFTVDPTPIVDGITGLSTVCAGAAITLSDSSGGGTWSSSTATTASVSATGVVTGITGGVDTISYTLLYFCGPAIARHIVTINALPDTGSIAGLDSLCPGDTTTMTETAASGSWSSSNTSVATVNSAGLVTALTTGSAIILYTATNSCGSLTASYPITIRSISACPESIHSVNISQNENLIIYPNPACQQFTLLLSSPTRQEAQITITNLTGQVVKTLQTTTNKSVDISLDQLPGVYFVSAVTESGRWVEKINSQLH